MLDVGVVKVIGEGCFDVFVDVEFSDELIEDVGLFFRLGRSRWTETLG